MSRLRKKKTKKQEREQEAADEARLKHFEDLCDKYHGKTFDAQVRWFDALSGEGIVRLPDDRSVYLNYTAIKGIDKHNWACPNEADRERLSDIQGRPCKARLCVFGGGDVWVDYLELEGL
jgi:hypothetical protein